MVKIYEINKFEFDEEKFNESLVLADQDKPTIGIREKNEWAKAIGYVARAYWAHFNDEKKAYYYFKKIYDQGGLISDYVYYGLCYFYAYGVERDSQKACDILENAYHSLEDSERYHGWAWQMYQMAWYYHNFMEIKYNHYEEIKKELTQTKEELAQTKEENTLIKGKWSADVKDYNNLLEQHKAKCASYNALETHLSLTKKEWTDKYNQLVNEYNTLLNKSKSACLTLAAENQSLRTDVSSSSDAKSEMASKYNQLVSRYNELCDQYERLVAENARNAALAAQAVQTVQSSQSNQSDRVKVKICYGYVDDKGRQSNNWVKRIEMPKDEYKALLNGSMKAREAYVKTKWLYSGQRAVNVTIALDE